jgi:hypothetical protein
MESSSHQNAAEMNENWDGMAARENDGGILPVSCSIFIIFSVSNIG